MTSKHNGDHNECTIIADGARNYLLRATHTVHLTRLARNIWLNTLVPNYPITLSSTFGGKKIKIIQNKTSSIGKSKLLSFYNNKKFYTHVSCLPLNYKCIYHSTDKEKVLKSFKI